MGDVLIFRFYFANQYHLFKFRKDYPKVINFVLKISKYR